MPRSARKKSNIDLYHVIVQGINKEKIFDKDLFKRKYLKIMIQKKNVCKIDIISFCLMNNHAHFIIHSKDINELSKYMQMVNSSYSNFYNKFNNRVGFVFRDRFYTQEIVDLRQLYTCIKYIHFNPVKANIVAKPNEYAFSSYNEFLHKLKIVDCIAINILFDGKENYAEEFKSIHNTNEDDEKNFVDIKPKNFEEFCNEFELMHNLKCKKLMENKGLLKQFIKEVRINTDIKYNELAEFLNISKSQISKLQKNT